jgi:uncharacterized protein YcaQ
MMRQIPIAAARRIALAAQGFDRPRPSGRIDARHIRRVLDRVQMLQLDTVNVISRAHYLPLFARLGDYPREAIDRYAYEQPAMFEYWGHALSLFPVEHYPLLRFRRDAKREWRAVTKIKAESPGFIEEVYRQIAERGPLTVSDLGDRGKHVGGWWRNHGRIALDYLFSNGRITSSRIANFGRLYDLPERSLPASVVEAPRVSREEAELQLVRQAASAMGIGTAHDLGDYYRIGTIKGRQLAEILVELGELEPVRVEGWKQPSYLWHEARHPRQIRAQALLSPFDSLIWYRDRVERLWDFFYRIEIYVPEAKRVHGYYVLPFLLGEDLVGRVDLKADRKAKRLLVRSTWLEPGAEAALVVPALADELRLMAGWLGLGEIEIEARGDLAPALRSFM